MLQLFAAVLIMLCLAACAQIIRNSGDVSVAKAQDGALRFATYNVHYIILGKSTGAWSVGDWERRKGPLDQAFKALQADLVAFQEMESFARGNDSGANLTLDWLLDQNADYAAAAVGDPTKFPSTQPILYRPDRLRLLDQGWFFFSDTPEVIYSRTFNGSYPAFASWALFVDQSSGKPFRVVNVHFEYKSRSNRLQSAALVNARISPWIAAGERVFLVGDINARLGSATARKLAETGLDFAPIEGATYHFNRGLNLFGAIDHMAVAGEVDLLGEPFVIRRKFGGEWPTDHYPVVADFALR